ncbi:hypothetical protein ACPOL_1334 [Acidisarcina polymorpha]|uniref:Uncharacterized protein n=1 Tax=Acidisarcina polymorpha TaxID=2211140 RepID=A0A2Z5FVA2_9BACT|nr:hypothetical protein [Acidisarcina polymorpha]AXC10682.1 hypothetical protein ACPOL_1334 [Acidisarcina polymorpha]
MGLFNRYACFIPLTLVFVAGRGLTQGTKQSSPGLAISSVPASQMDPTQLRLVENSQRALADSARLYGFTLGESTLGGHSPVRSSYEYKEIACPLVTRHLLLAYESIQPNGSTSRFTATISRENLRNRSGHSVVQILPIQRAGAALFVPAWSSSHSIEVFNQAIAPEPIEQLISANAEHPEEPLLERSLCYLAMVGETPIAQRDPSRESSTIHAPVPTLAFLERGRVQQVFSVRSGGDTYQVWTFTYAAAGDLMAVAREPYSVHPAESPLLAASGGASSAYATGAVKPAEKSTSGQAPAASGTSTIPDASPAATSSLPLPARRYIPEAPNPPSRILPEERDPRPGSPPSQR